MSRIVEQAREASPAKTRMNAGHSRTSDQATSRVQRKLPRSQAVQERLCTDTDLTG